MSRDFEFLENAYLDDRERWKENQRTIGQTLLQLVGIGKEVGDHGRAIERMLARLDRHEQMLDRIEGSLDATLKALHRILEER